MRERICPACYTTMRTSTHGIACSKCEEKYELNNRFALSRLKAIREVQNKARKIVGIPQKKYPKGAKYLGDIALYKGDELIYLGRIEDAAAKTGLAPITIAGSFKSRAIEKAEKSMNHPNSYRETLIGIRLD